MKVENQINPLKVIEIYDFQANGYPANSIELYKIDEDTFRTLPQYSKASVLEKAKKKYQEENGPILAKIRKDKKKLYTTIREKIEVLNLFPPENGKKYRIQFIFLKHF